MLKGIRFCRELKQFCSSALWFLSLTLIFGHLVLFLLFLLVLGAQWFLSLVVYFFSFLFRFPAISVTVCHCILLTSCYFVTKIYMQIHTKMKLSSINRSFCWKIGTVIMSKHRWSLLFFCFCFCFFVFLNKKSI